MVNIFLIIMYFCSLGCLSTLFFRIFDAPMYIKALFFIWCTCVIGWIWLSEKRRFLEYIIPTLCMTAAFTAIYVLNIREDTFIVFNILLPVSAMPVLCYIGSRLAGKKQERKVIQINAWKQDINKYYNKKIDDISNVIYVIQNTYPWDKKIEKFLMLLDSFSGNDLKVHYTKEEIKSDQKLVIDIKNILLSYWIDVKIEKLLILLDSLSGDNLKLCFIKKAMESNPGLANNVKNTLSRYSIDINAECKTLSDVLNELGSLKHEYESRIYSDKQEDLKLYKKIKKEYKLVCGK